RLSASGFGSSVSTSLSEEKMTALRNSALQCNVSVDGGRIKIFQSIDAALQWASEFLQDKNLPGVPERVTLASYKGIKGVPSGGPDFDSFFTIEVQAAFDTIVRSVEIADFVIGHIKLYASNQADIAALKYKYSNQKGIDLVQMADLRNAVRTANFDAVAKALQDVAKTVRVGFPKRRPDAELLGDLAEGDTVDGLTIVDCSLSLKLSGATFSKCVFKDCRFIDSVFNSCTFTGCDFMTCGFQNCEFSSTKFTYTYRAAKDADPGENRNTVLRDCTFFGSIGCRFNHCVCDHAEFYGLLCRQTTWLVSSADSQVFLGCKFGPSSPEKQTRFDDATLVRVQFLHCSLDGVVFAAANISHGAFLGCSLKGVNLGKANLARCDFSGTEHTRISGDLETNPTLLENIVWDDLSGSATGTPLYASEAIYNRLTVVKTGGTTSVRRTREEAAIVDLETRGFVFK
ncbi:MAG: pentapeptide repeat-containing protein, partial [Burkholderiales bacterium]